LSIFYYDKSICNQSLKEGDLVGHIGFNESFIGIITKITPNWHYVWWFDGSRERHSFSVLKKIVDES